MKFKLNKTFSFILGVAFTALVFCAAIVIYLNRETIQETVPFISEPKREYALEKEIAVYIPYWDQENAYVSLEENMNYIHTVHPYWYKNASDGSITKFNGAENKKLLEFCQDQDFEIVPVVTNEFDASSVQAIISDSETREEHIENIMKLIEENDYDGISIDYENMAASDREDFTAFIEELADEIHAENKTLAISVHAKTSDSGEWDGPASQDWKALGEAADRFKIMTYDYHWSTSTAGDIAPVSWMEDVYDYAVTVVPEEKIMIGLHFYGYDWVGAQATGLTYEEVQDLIKEQEIAEEDIRTSLEDEKYFEYTVDDVDHSVYFADSETILKRLPLVSDYRLAGVGIWRLGGEDQEIWNEIASEFGPNDERDGESEDATEN